MLRHVVGNDAFFNIMKAYYNSTEHQYGTATTEGFQVVCEQVSGMNLDKFFHQWVYEEFPPQYAYSWTWTDNGSGYEINLEIQQEQTNYFFWMPIDITVTTAEDETTFVVWDSLQAQSFQLYLTSEPISLELDKNDWILKIIESSSPDSIPTEITLHQNYPNPFNGTTVIEYDLPEDTKVTLNVYDLLGRKIKTLVNKNQSPGKKTVIWNGTDNADKILASGVYIYRIQPGNKNALGKSRKLVYLK